MPKKTLKKRILASNVGGNNMRKEFKIIIALLVSSIFLIQIIKPLKELLLLQDIDDINANLISGLLTRAILIGILIYPLQQLVIRIGSIIFTNKLNFLWEHQAK